MKFIQHPLPREHSGLRFLDVVDPKGQFITAVNQKAGQQLTQEWYLKRHWGAVARSVFAEVQANLMKDPATVSLWTVSGAQEAADRFYAKCREATTNTNEHVRTAMRLITSISLPPLVLDKNAGVNGGTMHVTYQDKPEDPEEGFLFQGALGADALETMRALYTNGSYDTFM
jgi:hypothetical protein